MKSDNAQTSNLSELQDELWRVWCTVKKAPIADPLTPDELTEKGKELLEVAVIGKKLTEFEVAIDLWGLDSAFKDYVKNWKDEKLFWACQVYLNADGSIVSKTSAIEFRNRFKNYCDEKFISLDSLEKSFLEKVASLPFFPVYDWLFVREIEHKANKPGQVEDVRERSEVTNEIKSKDADLISESSQDRFNTKNLVLIVIGIIFFGAITKSCMRDHSKEHAKETSKSNSISEGNGTGKPEAIRNLERQLEKIRNEKSN